MALPSLSSMKKTLGSRISTGLPSFDLVLGADARADHLLGRDAVDVLGVDPDELLAAAGDDVGAEAVGAQVVHHLEHRLVDELGESRSEARVLRLRRPVGDDRLEVVDAHAGVGGGDDLLQSFSVNLAIAAWSPVSTALNGSVVFHSGCSGAISARRSSAKRPWP